MIWKYDTYACSRLANCRYWSYPRNDYGSSKSTWGSQLVTWDDRSELRSGLPKGFWLLLTFIKIQWCTQFLKHNMIKHTLRIWTCWLATCFVLWTQAQDENALLADNGLIQGTRRWTTAERKLIGSRPFICGLLALAIGCALWSCATALKAHPTQYRPPFPVSHCYPKCRWLFPTMEEGTMKDHESP